jgi:hypothetical protein
VLPSHGSLLMSSFFMLVRVVGHGHMRRLIGRRALALADWSRERRRRSQRM